MISVARRVLAYRAGALGDTLLLLPALRALRRWAGERGRLEVAGTRPYVELVLGEGLSEAVHDAGGAGFRSWFEERVDDREAWELLEGLDAVVAWGEVPALAGRAKSLGIECLVAPALPPPGIHASDHYLRTLAPLGVGVSERAEPARLSLAAGASAAATAWLGERGLTAENLVVVHPSSGSLEKNWPVARFARFGSLVERGGFQVLWVEGPADRDVVSALAPARDRVARGLDLPRLAAILASSRLYVGNDSGVTHLAAAVGARVLALFGSTDPLRWAPRGDSVQIATARTSAEQLWGFARDAM